MDREERLRRLAAVVTARLDQSGDSLRDVAFRAHMSETTLRKVTKMRGELREEKLEDLSTALGLDPMALLDVADGVRTPAEILATTDTRTDSHPPSVPASPHASGWADEPAIDLLSGYEGATSEQLLEAFQEVRDQLESRHISMLLELVVARALDELVEGTEWSVEGARPEWGADLVLVDPAGERRVLVKPKAAPTRGYVSVDAPIGRALRMRARASRAWGREVDYWVIFDTDPGPQVIAAFDEVGVPMGWVGWLPELPAHA